MPFLFINNNMAEKTELKINKAVEFLEKINSKQDERQTRSLNQKMVDSLTSIDKNTEDTNQLLKGVELANSRKQKETVSIFKSMLSKFFPKDKDMNRTDDNEEKNYREKLLKGIFGLGDKLKGLKDKGIFGLLFSLLGGLLKGLFNGFKRLIFPMISSLFKYAVLPILKMIAKPFMALGKSATGFLAKTGRRLGRRATVTAGRSMQKAMPFVDDALLMLSKNSSKFLRLIGGTAKGLAKAAGPVGIAIAALDAGITGVSKAANAGELLNKSEELITAGDRVRAAQAGVIESLSFGLISAEKFIEVQDKVNDTMISGAEKIFGKSIVSFGRTALNFFDVIISDFLELLTGGTFWSDWRSGWNYLKNNFSTAIKDMFIGFGESIKSGISAGATFIYNSIGGMNNPILKWMQNLVSEVTEGWKNVYNLYIANNPVFKFFKDVGISIANSITSLYDSLINRIKNSSVGKYLTGALKSAASITESDDIARQDNQAAQSNLKPAQIVRDNKVYKDIKEAEKSRVASIQSNVSNAFKMNKNSPVNNLSGDDKRLAVLMNFLLEQFAPYMSQLNAEAEKEGGNLQNVALVNPMR